MKTRETVVIYVEKDSSGDYVAYFEDGWGNPYILGKASKGSAGMIHGIDDLIDNLNDIISIQAEHYKEQQAQKIRDMYDDFYMDLSKYVKYNYTYRKEGWTAVNALYRNVPGLLKVEHQFNIESYSTVYFIVVVVFDYGGRAHQYQWIQQDRDRHLTEYVESVVESQQPSIPHNQGELEKIYRKHLKNLNA